MFLFLHVWGDNSFIVKSRDSAFGTSAFCLFLNKLLICEHFKYTEKLQRWYPEFPDTPHLVSLMLTSCITYICQN